MTKIVINNCYGGFCLSDDAIRLYLSLKNIPYEERNDGWGNVMFCEPNGDDWSLFETIHYMKRTDPDLVYVVETLGKNASFVDSHLIVVDIPQGTRYRIVEYDGNESIETVDDIEWEIA